MRVGKTILLGLALALACASTSQAQQADDDAMVLRDGASASVERVEVTAAEIRQARALERHRQRVARIEARNWAGVDPLRPNVAANPFSQSYYRVYIPYGQIWTVVPYSRTVYGY